MRIEVLLCLIIAVFKELFLSLEAIACLGKKTKFCEIFWMPCHLCVFSPRLIKYVSFACIPVVMTSRNSNHAESETNLRIGMSVK